jgi:glycosyltransferase involved in cell wall biosynthesis
MPNPLVTVGLPIYKRLRYLTNALRVVEAQGYPNLELLVSDNGMNGTAVYEIVKKHYRRPFRFRQNSSIVEMSIHYNQIIDEAQGEYFVLLNDDDEISPNYVSELVDLMERSPQASIGMSTQEIMDESGKVITKSRNDLPALISGPEFIRATWQDYEYGFACFATFLSRTDELRACGGFPDFCKGHSNDDALVVKLCINGYIVFGRRSTFRHRVYESSYGLSNNIRDIALATRQFQKFLDVDPKLQKFALTHPAEWQQIKKVLGTMNWNAYYTRWQGIYRKRLTPFQWVKAGFALPFIPAYYMNVGFTLAHASKRALLSRMKRTF